MTAQLLLDAAGRRRSPATVPGYRAGFAPRNKGMRYPADPPRVEEIIAVMRTAGDGLHGARVRALIVVRAAASRDPRPTWQGREAPREVGMDDWGWEHVEPWARHRLERRGVRFPPATRPCRTAS